MQISGRVREKLQHAGSYVLPTARGGVIVTWRSLLAW
ncbi:hypothetical protein Ahy_B02g058981 isoform B [Arachis hypogaea]|uniref:Uncharacterized protein n=1 Tax=Arachis hypogaea TaxID=3818 RepID=A0A445AFX0_ARAHY|nr:hypothetical protein Ahy_B02g058981 isoform B [Arachis hypogaea]